MGPREECHLHPAKPCELHPDLGSNLRTKARPAALPDVAGASKASTMKQVSVLQLQPDRVQCMVCHKCGLCCAARKHEVRPFSYLQLGQGIKWVKSNSTFH